MLIYFIEFWFFCELKAPEEARGKKEWDSHATANDFPWEPA